MCDDWADLNWSWNFDVIINLRDGKYPVSSEVHEVRGAEPKWVEIIDCTSDPEESGSRHEIDELTVELGGQLMEWKQGDIYTKECQKWQDKKKKNKLE